MIPKSTSKFILSLHQKKYRQRHQAFLVEGAKSVTELLQSDLRVQLLLVTPQFLESCAQVIPEELKVHATTEAELQRLGTFESNNAALAVVAMPAAYPPKPAQNALCLALDDVRDPGNLGTIARIADWYGISTLICSNACADFYNPKTIAASMGSFTRLSPFYTDLQEYLTQARKTMPVYAAALEGESVYRKKLKPTGILVMGNEANGISAEVMQLATEKLTIPRFGHAESLNVAIATAILCDNFYRNSAG